MTDYESEKQEIANYLKLVNCKIDPAVFMMALKNYPQQMRLRALRKVNIFLPSGVRDCIEFCSNNGLTKDELLHEGMLIYNKFNKDYCSNADRNCDVIISDKRAVIAFFAVFTNFLNYVNSTDKDLTIAKEFGKQYAICDPELHPDIVNNNFIQQGSISANCKIREVIFIGNEDKCKKICDLNYGLGNWKRRQYNFTLQYKQTVTESETKSPEELKQNKEENKKNLENLIDKLDGIL